MFTYNNFGSPTVYRGKALQWSYGKVLTNYDGVSFVYDGTGRRVNKNAINYVYDSAGNLIAQSNGLEFIYDNSGVAGVIYADKQYFYRKDAQGNIIAILDSDGNLVVKYVYDAWGNHAVIDGNGQDIVNMQHIGNLNPFRYRSYYYDTETGLYYLQTRYYDPELGRFISQDSIEYADYESVNGLNLYAYCGNNPVMYVDPDGTKPKWWEWILSGATLLLGIGLCFVPGGQGIGAGLIVAGGSMLGSNIMSAAGVNGKTASLISSGLDIVAGIALCFTPFAGLGASLIGSGIVGIAGGFISESLGGSFELGSAIGSVLGSLIGGKIYNTIKFTNIAKQGILIGKVTDNFDKVAVSKGLSYYSGMPGYPIAKRVLGSNLANKLGWAHNYHYISNVMKFGGKIYDLGGALTGSYAKEVALIKKFMYKLFYLV